MEHVLLKAATTATDQGVFEAVISTESVDREKDVVSANGMVAALLKWNRPVPLSWNHSTKAEDIIGHVDPQSARNINGEVVVNGQVDLTSTQGTEAWRSFKSRTVGFSFGYLIPDGGSSKRAGGGRQINELDVFEVTATPTPMNNDTRALSTKGAKQADAPPTSTQTRILNSMIGQAQEYISSDPDPEDAAEMADVLESLEELLGEPDTEDEGPGMMDEGKALKAALRELRHAGLQEPTWVALPQNFKDELTARLKPILDEQKSVDETDKETTRSRSVDPLRAQADAVELEFASGGESNRKPPAQKKDAPKPRPQIELDDLRRRMRDETLKALSGVEEL